MKKPGGAPLVQQQGVESTDALHPGKRTLTEQVSHPVAQRAPAHPGTGPAAADATSFKLQIAPAAACIDRMGFVDNSKGAPIYNAPAEAGGTVVRDAPLLPATRVFVSGTHPRLKHWWYVTAYLEQTMMRGYIEDFRINTDLPEPLAELRQLVGGETAEGLAREKFGHAVADGHDLRYYENILLYVNQGRKGIKGTYQDPNILGRGSNNIQLIAPHRIWLVSAEYAKTLESVVPAGSLTGGAVAKVKRFAGHLQDILQSVTESRHYFDEVAGEFAQAIRDHLPAIVGITAGFLVAESGAMFLAAAPTGVSQILAALIQLALSAFGAAGMVEAGVEALKHGSAWLTIAWTAHGKTEIIAEASKEFLRMLVAIAVAALSYTGAKANYRNALKMGNNFPTGGLPAFATIHSAPAGGVQAGTGIAIGPSAGAFGAAGNAALRLTDREKAALGEGPDVDGLQDRNIGEARAREQHDRRAADGRQSSSGAEGDHGSGETGNPATDGEKAPRRRRTPRIEANETRTNLAKHIPPPGPAFVDWFDSLTVAELDRLLADKGVRGGARGAAEIIAENVRHPGTMHEWLMVAELRQFKRWGVSMKTVQDGRTFTLATIGRRFRHGAAGSGAMHRQLKEMIHSSNSYPEFVGKLNQWADRELFPSRSARWSHDTPRGRYSLPDNLQVQSEL